MTTQTNANHALQMEFAPWLHDTDATYEDKKRLEGMLIRRLGLDKKEE